MCLFVENLIAYIKNYTKNQNIFILTKTQNIKFTRRQSIDVMLNNNRVEFNS